ncbi:GNAT family N-acetyltransferase [Paenibacillus durus]|uniref:GNAT family N-acetyltransferase n=1 Tax=Paenibacillus durus TaxID=44251 RepID=UPI000AE8ACCE|nr:GNAT family N-acetyltransferase [Paenibacillus durus]
MAYSHKLLHGVELTSQNFCKASGLFDDLNQHLSIKGVISGVVPGRVFLSNDCKTAVLMSPQGFFLGGSPENTSFFEEVNKLLSKELLPKLASSGKLDYVVFYPSDETWENVLKLVMKDLLPLRSGRMTFTHDLNGVDTSHDDCIIPVNASLLKRQDLVGLNELIGEIQEGWPSLEAYEDRGFGCVAIQNTDEDPTIISWCLTDWVVGNECELGIQTGEKISR